MSETRSLELPLKPEFREPVQAESGFVGRDLELARLTTLFRHRSAATVLVSGHRGVGKSALVEEALRTSKQGRNEKRRIVARLTLPHLEAKQELRGQILRSLARALYFAIKEGRSPGKKLKERAAALYQKTYLRDIEQHAVLESIAQSEARSTERRKTETVVDFSGRASVLLGASLGIGGSLGASVVVSNIVLDHGLGWGAATAFVIALAIAASVVTVKRVTESESTATDALTTLDSRSETGRLDISSDTLEFELRDLLQDLSREGYPCIFVLDELDKLEIDIEGADLLSHPIHRIVASLKNFFTLGSGIFIFISGEDFYRELETSIAAGEYSLAHTLFTDRMFIHALHYSGLELLIDNMLKQKPPRDVTYRKFRNYLCWASRNHVFDLLALTNDFVGFDNDGQPVIKAELPGPRVGSWREGNLPTNWETAAGLQKILGAVYDEHARPSSNQELFNQHLWRLLRHVAQTFLNQELLVLDEDEYQLPDVAWLPRVEATDRDDLEGAVQRLLVKLERYGMVRSTRRTVRPPTPSGATEDPPAVVKVTYRLADNPSYPPSSVSTEAQLIPFETAFVEFVDRIEVMLANMKDLKFSFEKQEEDIEEVVSLSHRLKNTTPRTTVQRSRVRQGFVTAEALAADLVGRAIHGEAAEWAEKQELSDTDDLAVAEPRTQQAWTETLQEFPDLVQAVTESKVEYLLIGGPVNDNQLLVLVNPDAEQVEQLSNAYSKALSDEKGRERRKQRLPVISVVVAPPDVPLDLPQEVVDVFDDVSVLNRLRAFFGADQTPVQKIQRIEGWNTFRLDPLLGNLKDLKGQLDAVSYVAVPQGPDEAK